MFLGYEVFQGTIVGPSTAQSQAPREATDAYASGEMVGVIPLSQFETSSKSNMTRIFRRLNGGVRQRALGSKSG